MLTDVVVKNFRCLRDITVRLEPLTIIVGPNASGKTTLLRALDPNWGGFTGPQDLWQRQGGTSERIFHFADGSEASSRWSDGHGRSVTHNYFFAYQYLQLDPRALRSNNKLSEERYLEVNGSNLANVFATLTRRQQERVVADFCRVVPVFMDVTPRPSGDGNHRLVFQDRWRGIWYEPHEVSDGSFVVLALLTLQHQNPPVELIAIEELEHALHPYLVGEILSVLRRMSHGELGTKPTQIVIATHSAELLEFAGPKEVRFLSRTAEGDVAIEEAPITAPDWERVIKDHQGSLGNLWLSGGLGGVPGGLDA